MNPDLYIVQQSFGFSLWALNRYGDRWRPPTFYEDIFLNAYSQVLGQIDEADEDEAEERVRQAYRRHVLVNFCEQFGLVELRYGEGFFGPLEAVRAADRFHRMVRFTV